MADENDHVLKKLYSTSLEKVFKLYMMNSQLAKNMREREGRGGNNNDDEQEDDRIYSTVYLVNDISTGQGLAVIIPRTKTWTMLGRHQGTSTCHSSSQVMFLIRVRNRVFRFLY